MLAIVILVPAILFPPRPGSVPVAGIKDSLRTAQPISAVPPSGGASALSSLTARPPTAAAVDTLNALAVHSALYEYRFSPRGARLTSARMKGYRTFAVGDSGDAELIPAGSEFLAYQLVVGNDTVSLADWAFTASAQDVAVGLGGGSVDWVATRGGVSVRLRYTFAPDAYLFRVAGQVSGLGGAGGLMLVGMGPGIRSVEA